MRHYAAYVGEPSKRLSRLPDRRITGDLVAPDIREIKEEVRQTAIKIRHIEGIPTYGDLSRSPLLDSSWACFAGHLWPWPRRCLTRGY
jgi:hypothetical protein